MICHGCATTALSQVQKHRCVTLVTLEGSFSPDSLPKRSSRRFEIDEGVAVPVEEVQMAYRERLRRGHEVDNERVAH